MAKKVSRKKTQKKEGNSFFQVHQQLRETFSQEGRNGYVANQMQAVNLLKKSA